MRRRSRLSFLGRGRSIEPTENNTFEDQYELGRIMEGDWRRSGINTDQTLHKEYSSEWVPGGSQQELIKVLMGSNCNPKPGRNGGLNFGQGYLTTGRNNFSDYRDFRYSESLSELPETDSIPEGLYERWVLDTLDRLKRRLVKAKPPILEVSEEEFFLRVGSNKPYPMKIEEEIFAFMHAQKLGGWSLRRPREAFMCHLMAPHLKDLQDRHPVEWVKARAEYMIGYVAEMCLLRDLPSENILKSLEHVAPLACNIAPHAHLNKRRYDRTPEREPWLALAQSWDQATAPALLAFTLKCQPHLDLAWFKPENGETSAVREQAKRLRVLIENGLNIDRLSDLYLAVVARSGASEANLGYCFDLLEKFYDPATAEGMPRWARFKNEEEAFDFKTHRSGRTRTVPAWVNEDQDFTQLFDWKAERTVFETGKCALAFDETGKAIIEQLFSVAGPESSDCLTVFKRSGYQLQTRCALSIEKALEITHFLTVRYGLGNPERVSRVLDLLITLLPNSDGVQQEKFINDFLSYADKKAPDSPWRSVMEGDDASIDFPGMGCLQVSMLGTPEHNGQIVEDNNVTAERLLLVDRFLSLPLEERSKLKPLLQYHLNQSPLLTTQVEETLSLESLEDEPRINNGLGDLFSFYEQTEQECLSEGTLNFYFTFIAPKMPDPLNPPAGFLRLYENIMHARDTDYANEVLFANPYNGDRERAERNQAQKTVNRQTLLADLVHLWGQGLVTYEQLELWLKWVHGSVETSEKETLRAEVITECEYLHPRHYEDLDPALAAAKLEKLTAGFRREYDLNAAQYEAVFEEEAEAWTRGEEYDASYLNGEEVRYSALEPIDLAWESFEKRHQATIDTLYNNRLRNLFHRRSKLSPQRLKFLEQVFPLLGIVGKNASLGALLSQVIIDLMNSAVEMGDVDPLNSPASAQLITVLSAVNTEVSPEEYGLPEFLLDRDRLARFSKEADAAWKVITVFESIRQAYEKTQTLATEYRREFERSMAWGGDLEDFDFEGDVIREQLTLFWKDIKDAVPANLIEVLMSTHFNRQSLMALSKAVKGFREKALSTITPARGRFSRHDSYTDITANMLTLGSVGQGLARLACSDLNEAERVSAAQVLTPADSHLPTFFRPDFKTDPAQMEAAFLEAYPHFKAQVRHWRQADFGLLPGGAKVHVIKPFDSSHIDVVKHIFGLDQTSFQLIHADQSLLLPPVPSSEELKHMLLLLEHLGIFKGGIDPELQITVPGRLEDKESLAILGASVILASSRNYPYREDAFGTSHNDQTASRMLAYDAGARNSRLPMMFGLEGRTDILGRFDPDDISNYRLLASVLIQHEKGVGPYQDLAVRFKKDFIEQVLKPHGLSDILQAPWIHPFESAKRGTPEENTQHYQAVNACMNRYFADAQTMVDTGELGRAVATTHKLIGELGARFRAERNKVWNDPKYSNDRDQLFENL